MKFLKYTAALTAVLGLSLLAVGCGGNEKEEQLKEDAQSHYGDSVTEINVSSVQSLADSETKIYTVTAKATDGTEFTIDSYDIKLNSYLTNYFENYMEERATELLKEHFTETEFTIDVTIQADDTDFIPGGELMSYEDFMKDYADVLSMRPRMNIKADIPHTKFAYTDFYNVAKDILRSSLIVSVLDIDFSDNFNYMTYPETIPVNIFEFVPTVTEKTQAQLEALDSVAELNK